MVEYIYTCVKKIFTKIHYTSHKKRKIRENNMENINLTEKKVNEKIRN